MASVGTIFAAIAVVIVILIGSAVGLFFLLPRMQHPTSVTSPASSSSSSSLSSVSSSSSSGSSSSSLILNGNFTAKVTSVNVTKVGFNGTIGAEIFRSDVTIQFTTNKPNNVVNYTFSVEPWNLILMQGTEDQVQFMNGQLIGVQPDVSGVIQDQTHITLHMIISGMVQNVPSGIGITGGIISPIHTHDTSNVVDFGISIPNYNFTLGEMFSEWGYDFNSSCLWGNSRPEATVQVYINSTTPYTGSDPQSLVVPPNVPTNDPTNVTIVWTP